MRMVNLGCGRTHHPDWINVDFAPSDETVIRHDLLKDLPFEDCDIDVVYHYHVLEHLSPNDGRRLMAECFRILKPGGIVRVGVPDLEDITREYLRCLEAAQRGDPGAAARYDWTTLELLDQLVRRKSGGDCGDYLFQDDLPAADYVFARWGGAAQSIRAAHERSKRHRLRKATLRERILGRIKHPLRRRESEAERTRRFMFSGENHLWMYDRYSLDRLVRKSGFAAPAVADPIRSVIPRWREFRLEEDEGVVFKPHTLVMEALKPAKE